MKSSSVDIEVVPLFDGKWLIRSKEKGERMTRKKYPTFNDTFFDMAKILSRRATCPRKNVACIIVDEYNSIVSAGYNTAPLGVPTCLDAGCILEGGHCVRAVHAEMNALASAARNGISLKGCIAYCTLLPCIQCAQALATAGVRMIVYDEVYDRPEAGHLQKLVSYLNLNLVARRP